jgi:hypothetical protein
MRRAAGCARLTRNVRPQGGILAVFIPAAEGSEQAERVYRAIAVFNGAPVSDERIWRLSWRHNGQAMSCTVGEPLPPYYRTGSEPVLAILDCGNLYKVCTPNRGGLRGEAVLAGKSHDSHVTYFAHEA